MFYTLGTICAGLVKLPDTPGVCKVSGGPEPVSSILIKGVPTCNEEIEQEDVLSLRSSYVYGRLS